MYFNIVLYIIKFILEVLRNRLVVIDENQGAWIKGAVHKNKIQLYTHYNYLAYLIIYLLHK